MPLQQAKYPVLSTGWTAIQGIGNSLFNCQFSVNQFNPLNCNLVVFWTFVDTPLLVNCNWTNLSLMPQQSFLVKCHWWMKVLIVFDVDANDVQVHLVLQIYIWSDINCLFKPYISSVTPDSFAGRLSWCSVGKIQTFLFAFTAKKILSNHFV